MNGTENLRGTQTLAEIEASLIAAEAAYADADSRLKQAEHDRKAALDTINRFQSAFDEAISQIRKRSIPGSKWCDEMEQTNDPLILDPDQELEKINLMSQAKVASVKAEFLRLKDDVVVASTDPILKVAIGRGQSN